MTIRRLKATRVVATALLVGLLFATNPSYAHYGDNSHTFTVSNETNATTVRMVEGVFIVSRYVLKPSHQHTFWLFSRINKPHVEQLVDGNYQKISHCGWYSLLWQHLSVTVKDGADGKPYCVKNSYW